MDSHDDFWDLVSVDLGRVARFAQRRGPRLPNAADVDDVSQEVLGMLARRTREDPQLHQTLLGRADTRWTYLYTAWRLTALNLLRRQSRRHAEGLPGQIAVPRFTDPIEAMRKQEQLERLADRESFTPRERLALDALRGEPAAVLRDYAARHGLHLRTAKRHFVAGLLRLRMRMEAY